MIKQFVSQAICLECQGCCRFAGEDSLWSPYLLAEEIEDLLNKNIPPSLFTFDKKIRLVAALGQNSFACAFLNTQDNFCKIYSFRPFECQLYPFLINRNADKVFLATDLNCPFIEKNLESKEFQEYIKYLTKLLNSPDILNILKNNPQVIQAYPKVLNLAELKL